MMSDLLSRRPLVSRVKAVQLVRFGERPLFEARELPDPGAGEGEVVVALKAAALNRRDAWLWRLRDSFPLPATLGSDGAGTIVALGSGVSGLDVGDPVVINPALNWGEREDRASEGFEILGVPTSGTFAEQVSVPAANVARRPVHLGWEQAAALNLAGLTAWRAVVTCGQATSGQTVLITGAAGGVATFAIQIACARGATVFVTSSNRTKIERAGALGAAGGFDYRDDSWVEDARLRSDGGFDIVIDSAGPRYWAQALEVLKPGGTIVTFGSTSGIADSFDSFPLFWNWQRVLGTTMGSPRDYRGLLGHMENAAWQPVIDSVFELDTLGQAAERLESPDRFGKVALRIC
jgi:zinc-binding alcohol dehydrogenase/oxidoreductase